MSKEYTRQGQWSIIKPHEDQSSFNTPRSTIKLHEDMFFIVLGYLCKALMNYHSKYPKLGNEFIHTHILPNLTLRINFLESQTKLRLI